MKVGESVEIESQLLQLIEASNVLLTSTDSGEVLRNLLTVGQQFIRSDAYALWRMQEDGTQWWPTLSAGLSEAYCSVPASGRSINEVSEAPIGIEDVIGSPVFGERAHLYEAEGIRSMLIVAFPVHGEEWGTVVFYYRTPHRFSDAEIKLGTALRNLAATALARCELYEQQKRLREAAEHSARRSKFLAEAGEAIASSLHYEETAQILADLAVPFFADWCAVAILEEGEVRELASKHINPAKLEVLRELGKRYPPGDDSAVMSAFRTGRSVLIKDFSEQMLLARAQDEEHERMLRKAGIRSFILAPLITRGQRLGCITFAVGDSRQRYSEEDLALAEEIARRAAVAIDNARLHREVLASQQQWETVANSIPQMAWMADEKGDLFWYNRRWYEYTGTTFEQVQGWRWTVVHHPDHLDRVLRTFKHALESGEPWEDTFPLRSKEGEWRWFLSRALPIRDDSGCIVRWFGSNTDVTEERTVREALEASKAALARRVSEFETLLEVTPIGLVVAYDRECHQIRTNRAYAEWVGTSVDANISQTAPAGERLPYRIFKNGRQLSGEELPMQTAAREGKEVMTEVDLVRDDGRVVSIFGYSTPLFDEHGTPRGSVGAFINITDRLRREEERQQLLAREREARASAELLNRIGPLLLTELDLHRLVQAVTDVARELTGAEFGSFFYNVVNETGESYSLFTLSGAPREVFEKFGMPRKTAVFQPTFDGEGPLRSDDITQDPRYGRSAPHFGMPKGHPPVRSYLGVPVISRSGKVLGGLFFGHSAAGQFSAQHEALIVGIAAQAAIAIDNANLFEETRRTQDQLQRANDELKRANGDLEQFAYSASHDLREPLRNVGIYSQMIARRYAPQLDEDGLQFLKFIIDGARRMDALVNDLMAFTRAGAPDGQDGTERTSASEALQGAILNLASAIQESDAEIIYGELPDLPVRKVHLEQLFQNLLGNSIKYRSPEAPRIHVRAERKDGSWVFSVKDNGIGVEPEYRQRIFGIFKRLHREEDYPGTGMGLAICQRIVERYHGRIWVESEQGHGATFFFTVPA